jgi:hypothetical protein
MGTTCMKAMKYCFKQVVGNYLEFTKLFLQQYDHYCNFKHTDCTHKDDFKPKYWFYVINELGQDKLKDLFSKIIAESPKYMTKFNLQRCEA